MAVRFYERNRLTAAEYRAMTPEEKKERRRESHRNSMKRARLRDPEKYRQRDAVRRTKEERHAYMRLYQKERLQVRAFHCKALALRKYGAPPEVTGRALAALYKKQRGRCALTGRKLTRGSIQLDHIYPLSRGGGRGLSNLRWVCKAANRAKDALTDTELMQLCREILCPNLVGMKLSFPIPRRAA